MRAAAVSVPGEWEHMTDHARESGPTRRAYLRALGAIGATAFGATGPAAARQEYEAPLEIVHWWTAGGEEEALNALLEGFQEEYPDAEIDNNPAPGGAGSAIDAVIQSRIIDEEPPSTFQIWPGESLRPYLDADVLANVGDLWDDEIQEAYLEGPMEAARPDGTFVSVPLNIHRLNNLFYNVEVIEEAGVDVAGVESPGDLVGVLETIESETDAVGMANQTASPWSTLQLWETVFVGQHGTDAFQAILDGEAADRESEIREAFEVVTEYEAFFPEDAGAIAWDEGNAQVITGGAATIHQGDWAAGQYKAEGGFEFETDWEHVPFPGTEGVYSLVMDSFVMPEPNPTPTLTENFLDYVGTVDAQERFNPIKGSIPPRTDVPDDEFGPFLSRQKADFAEATDQPTTIAHGSAVDPSLKSEVEEVVAAYTEHWNPERATTDLVGVLP
jgi:glucose/mannose transport system substrate-binding protein